jgi:cyclopropane-fatty-acyl-phospholipid synthase
MWYVRAVQTNLVPDWLIRSFLRLSLSATLRQRYRAGVEERIARRRALLQKLRQSPIAIHTDVPNQQHYELPSEFFQLVLGRRLKYSCCHWPEGVTTIDEAEDAMLYLTCHRAQLADGMDILELGCGWGSLCLWIAEHYPRSRVVALSNSRSQIAYIAAQCRRLGLQNVEPIFADVTTFDIDRQFDRVLSIEMFEHMKNYELLTAKVASFLKPGGLLFVHVFSHREFAYEFDAGDPKDWMAQHFFSGGTMPSDNLLLYFQRDLQLVDHWCINGTHYTRTLRAWLANLDRHQAQIRTIMANVYGAENETRWLVNWRLFFLACAEAWRLERGREYLVSHYLFKNR